MRLRLLALLSAACLVVGAPAGPAVAADETITISGTVLGDDGAALGGVDVRARMDSEPFETSTVTDSAGRYTVTVPLRGYRSYLLRFTKTGRWVPGGASAYGGPGKDMTGVNAQLTRYGSIRGAITSPTGSVAGVEVNLLKQGVGKDDDVVTGADGSYHFDDVVPGRYRVTFESDDFDRSYGPDDGNAVEYVDVAPAQDVALRTVGPRPPTPQSPTGTIVADLTGTRRQYPEVIAFRLDGTAVRSQQLYLGLDRPMVATLKELPPGQYKVSLDGSATWYGGLSWASAALVTVVAGQTTTIAAQPGRTTWTRGAVVNAAGDGINGLNLEILRSDSPGEVIADLMTGTTGGFQSTTLPAADYVLRVSDPTGTYAPRTFDLPPEPDRDGDDRYQLVGGPPVGPTYPGPISGSASGTYTGYRNPGDVCFVPASGRRGDDEIACGRFDGETHRYDVQEIKPGDYKVRTGGDEDDTTRLTWLGGRTFASATTFTMAPGEHKELDVPGTPDNGTFIGDVFGQRGLPMPQVTVIAYAADNPDEIIAVSDGWHSRLVAQGSWTLEGLPARPYKLKFVDPTNRYESRWLGGSSFATATAVTPRLAATIRIPDVTLQHRFGVLAPPLVSGDGYVGDRLTATPGFWTDPDLSYTYQWLRDGSPVPGENTATYDLTAADRDRRIAVRVVGRAPSGAQLSTTSFPTYKVTDRPSPEPDRPTADSPAVRDPIPRVRPAVKTTIKRLGDRKVRLTVRYAGGGVTPTGRVTVRRGSKTVMAWRQLKDGRFSITLRNQPKGRTRYTVRYSGSDRFTPDVRQTARVRVR